jgi:hypothetical protein
MAIELDLPGAREGPHRGGRGSIGATKLGVDPSGPRADQPVFEAEPPKHTHTVRLDCDACADLGQGCRLLVETDVHAALKQSVSSGGAADATANDRHA